MILSEGSSGGESWVVAQVPLEGVTLAYPVVDRLWLGGGEWTPFLAWVGHVLGAVAVVVGVVLFSQARRVLGRSLIANPVPRQDAVFHREGVYSAMRHPVYSAFILAAEGWAALWNSCWGLALSVLCAVFLVAKSRYEERALDEKFGEYRAYRAEVPAFVPRRR